MLVRSVKGGRALAFEEERLIVLACY